MVSSVIDNATANCICTGTGTNVVVIGGTDNVATGITQNAQINIDLTNGGCSLSTDFSGQLSANATTGAQQAAKTSSNNLSQILDWNATTQLGYISDNINATFSTNSTMDCLQQLQAQNVFVEAGTGNVADDVVQSVTDKISTSCISSDKAASNMSFATNIAANQSNAYSSSVLGNLADMFSALFSWPMVVAAVAFVILIALVMIIRAKKQSAAAASSAADMSSPAADVSSPSPAPASDMYPATIPTAPETA
jgi:hypothetical protein